MTKVATTGAKKSMRKFEYVFHLHRGLFLAWIGVSWRTSVQTWSLPPVVSKGRTFRIDFIEGQICPVHMPYKTYLTPTSARLGSTKKKGSKMFCMTRFHDEGVAVGSKRVLMVEKQTEIFRFRSFQLTWWRNKQMQNRWNHFSFEDTGHTGHTWCATFPHFFTKKSPPIFTRLLDEEISRPIT